MEARQRDDLDRGKRRAEEIRRAWRSMLAGVPDPELPGSEQMVTGKPDPETAESLPRQLLRLQFDLANNYGPPNGSAETNFGRNMREDLRPYRDELIVSTKAGHMS